MPVPNSGTFVPSPKLLACRPLLVVHVLYSWVGELELNSVALEVFANIKSDDVEDFTILLKEGIKEEEELLCLLDCLCLTIFWLFFLFVFTDLLTKIMT